MRSQEQRLRFSWLLTVATLVVLTMVACGGGPTPVERLSEAVSTSMGAESMRLSVTVFGTVGGERTQDAYEVSYLGPDRSRWLSKNPSSPVLERITIGNRLWTRSARGWSDPEPRGRTPAEPGGLSEVLAPLLAADEVSVLGEGAGAGEEGTTRYAAVIPDWGNTDADHLAALADEYPDLSDDLRRLEETFRDVGARFEVTVGDDTKLIHFVRIDLDGPKRQQTFELSFTDYNEPVTIEPPVP